MISVLLLAGVSLILAQTRFPLTFSGDASKDMVPTTVNKLSFANKLYPIYVVSDNEVNGVAQPDVGLPPGWPYPTSGWDIKDMRFAYDYINDIFTVAIHGFGVSGDADGDGSQSTTSSALAARGGQDLANFAGSESCAVAFDIGNGQGSASPDGVMDFIVGYPAEQNPTSDAYPCAANTFDTTCFGLYKYDQSLNTKQIGQRFVFKNNDAILSTAFAFAVDHNTPTTKAKPDLEWSITKFNTLHALFGVPPIDQTGVLPFSFNVAAFCGSFQDDGIGEDTYPNQTPFATITWPCFVFDACDICGGDGSTCRDCKGIANGPNKYDICDVCGGSGGRDCAGTACGTQTYDCCDVCGGDGSECTDCQGVCNGKSKYDVCDVCGGNGKSCLDCSGTPFGSAVYDACDICNSDGNSCRDCNGVAFGTAVYDVCGICGGNGLSCVNVQPPRDYCAPHDPNVCGFFPGDVFDIQLLDINSNSYNIIGGDAATYCIGERGFVSLSSADGTVFQRWSQQTDGSYLISDIGSDHANSGKKFLSCDPAVNGRYGLQWDDYCESATIVLKQDGCTVRRSAIGTATLQRRRCRRENELVYEIGSGTTWTGVRNDTTLERFWLGFCPNGAFMSTTGQSGQETFVFGNYQTAQGVVTFTDRFSVPDGVACAVTGDYDVDYEYLPRESNPYWSGREGHTSISSIPELSSSSSVNSDSSSNDVFDHSAVDSPKFGQFRKELEAPSDDDDDSSSSSSDESSEESAVESRRKAKSRFESEHESESTDSSSSSSSSSWSDSSDDSSSGSSSNSDRRSDDFFLRKRNELAKRNDVNRYHEGRAVAVLRTARISGRVVDKCAARAAFLTGKVIRDVDLCNGDIPVECFPARPPCDDSSETVDGYHHHCTKKEQEEKQARHHVASSSSVSSYYSGRRIGQEMNINQKFAAKVAAVEQREAESSSSSSSSSDDSSSSSSSFDGSSSSSSSSSSSDSHSGVARRFGY